jgi:hypothetical protein
MTTQEAIEKLRTYDELEGKYNEALARIDEYERERKEIADKANKALENPGVFTDRKALTEIADMLAVKPTYSDDDLEVGNVFKAGDVVERNGIKGIVYGIYDDGSLYGNYLAVMPLVSSNDAMLLATINGLLWEFETVQKTGKHYPQIAETLAAVRGEGENDEIAD